MLNTSNIGKSFGSKTLFMNLTLSVSSGERIALIGANGSGKTTLLDILSGTISPDSGKVSISPTAVIGYLQQDLVQHPGQTPLEAVLEESPDVKDLRQHIEHTYEALSSKPTPPNQSELLSLLHKLVPWNTSPRPFSLALALMRGYSPNLSTNSVVDG